MPSPLLDDDIALPEMNGFSVIQFEPHLAFENDCIIHCICFVHGSVFFFEVVRKPAQPAQRLFMRGVGYIKDQLLWPSSVSNCIYETYNSGGYSVSLMPEFPVLGLPTCGSLYSAGVSRSSFTSPTALLAAG
jgi:hypothetical protein